jgi:hypothetical protein
MMAVCGILERSGKVLLCKRLPWVRAPGLWELPTFEYEGVGTVEESLEQGLFERLSLKLEGVELFSTQNMRNITNCRIWSYRVPRWTGYPFLSGYGAYRFVSPKNLHRFAMVPDSVTLVKKFFSLGGIS